MALGWLTVLKTVPWGEVIANAPKVADGAKKLWNAVARKAPVQAPPADAAAPPGTSAEDAIAALEARLAPVEAAVADLHAQLLQSTELLQALAEQNAQLVQRAETLRVRLLWVIAATAILAVAVLAGFAWTMAR
jgi:hypothetical protein